MYLSLTQVAPSVYQMMRGILIVYVGLFSVLFLKRKLYCHHWSSMLTVTLGVAVVGVASLIAAKNEQSNDTSISGVIILLSSQLFIAFQQIAEEKILSGYDLDPFFLVGIEGFWGCIYFLIFLPIAYFIQIKGKPMEDSLSAFRELGEHP